MKLFNFKEWFSKIRKYLPYYSKPEPVVPDKELLPLEYLYYRVKVLRELGDVVNKPVSIRCRLDVDAKTETVQVPLEFLRIVAEKVKATTHKYIDKVPMWFYEPAKTYKYDRYLSVQDEFITEQELIEELYQTLTDIVVHLEDEHNEAFRYYYLAKISRLYRELIRIVDTI